MATPHVAGLIAYFIGLNGAGTPAALQATLASTARSGVLSGIRTILFFRSSFTAYL